MVGLDRSFPFLVFTFWWQHGNTIQLGAPKKSNVEIDPPEGILFTGAGTGPWQSGVTKRLEDVERRNICSDGKQLPDLYVLGVQKCGTSLLAKALVGAGVKHVHSPENAKELHFFNMPIKIDYSLEWEGDTGRPWLDYKGELLKQIKWEGATLEQNKQLWHDYGQPNCPTKEDGRSVLADFTPDYVRIVPKVSDLGGTNEYWRPVDLMNVSLPKFMRKMYDEEANKKITFTVMLREPLSQLQSAWYMANASNFFYCRACDGPNFQTVLREHVKKSLLAPGKRELSMWLWTTMYARQLEDWLLHYDASQFFVIPMNELGSDDTTEICEEFSRRLSWKMKCGKGAMEKVFARRDKPALEDDTTPDLLADFAKLMDTETDRLVKLLADAHNQGMSLAKYHGAKGDETAIRAWLTAGW